MKIISTVITLRLLCVLALSAPVFAHHGTAGLDLTKDVTVKGTVTEWIWANPHSYLRFDAAEEGGTVRTWSAEVSNPADMARTGWTRTMFKPGDVVTVTLQKAKNGAPVGRLRSVVLPSGETVVAGRRRVPVVAGN